MKSMFKSTLLLGLTTAMAVSSAMGAFTFTNGDLILGFQATGGTGADTNVFFNLGSSLNARNGVTSGLLGNISTTLSTVYGANWYDRTDVYFGIAGNLNQQPQSPAIGGRAPVGGDPSRTFYLSTAAAAPGDGILFASGTFANTVLGNAGVNLAGMETMLGTLGAGNADNSVTLNQGTQPTAWANGWTTWNPTPGAAFDVITGGIQQNFGKVTDSTYIDLQRVLPTNTGASPTGTVGGGDYIMTFAISETGDISVIPEPSAALLGSLGALALFRRRRA